MGGHRISPPFRADRAAASGALSIEAAWRLGLKTPEEVMEILEAFDATGSLRAAAELVGGDHKTGGHWGGARGAPGASLAAGCRSRRGSGRGWTRLRRRSRSGSIARAARSVPMSRIRSWW